MENNVPTTPARNNSTAIVLPIVGIIVIAAIGLFVFNSRQTETVTSPNMPPPAAVTNSGSSVDSETANNGPFKDGVYSVTGNYTSPGGQEEIGVTLTLADGVVTDSQVEVRATRPISKMKQTDFSEHYKTEVVGKSLSELQLSKVSGSSLTPKGFNDALQKIKAEAQS